MKASTAARIVIWTLVPLLLAAIILPTFIKARNTCSQNACINNLRMIDSGKEQAALAERWESARELSQGDVSVVNSYIKGDTTPECPQGGSYTYNPIGVYPICSGEDPGRGPHRMLGNNASRDSVWRFRRNDGHIFESSSHLPSDPRGLIAEKKWSGELTVMTEEYGSITSFSSWKRGKLHGMVRTWEADGTPLSQTYYTNDVAVDLSSITNDGRVVIDKNTGKWLMEMFAEPDAKGLPLKLICVEEESFGLAFTNMKYVAVGKKIGDFVVTKIAPRADGESTEITLESGDTKIKLTRGQDVRHIKHFAHLLNPVTKRHYMVHDGDVFELGEQLLRVTKVDPDSSACTLMDLATEDTYTITKKEKQR